MINGNGILDATAKVFSVYPEWKRKEGIATAAELRNGDFALVQEGICTEQQLVSIYAQICNSIVILSII